MSLCEGVPINALVSMAQQSGDPFLEFADTETNLEISELFREIAIHIDAVSMLSGRIVALCFGG